MARLQGRCSVYNGHGPFTKIEEAGRHHGDEGIEGKSFAGAIDGYDQVWRFDNIGLFVERMYREKRKFVFKTTSHASIAAIRHLFTSLRPT